MPNIKTKKFCVICDNRGRYARQAEGLVFEEGLQEATWFPSVAAAKKSAKFWCPQIEVTLVPMFLAPEILRTPEVLKPRKAAK